MNFRHIFSNACLKLVLGLACLSTVPAWAVDPFKVSDIRIEGLQRIEPGTVLASMPVRVGEEYTDDKGLGIIRSLFALGLFNDVRVETQGDVLIVVVQERPSIAELSFVGLKEFDQATITKALKEVGLSEGRPFDKALADRAEQELKRQYIARSLYGAEVITTVTPIERNRVNLSFSITEGEVAKIKSLRIQGAKVFSEATLLDQLSLDVGNWMSWYTKSDRYTRSKLNADLETLRSYYLSRGYVEFNIESTQVTVSPNKQDISISIQITEGPRYLVSGVVLEGNYLGRESEFEALVKIPIAEAYQHEKVQETQKLFVERLGKFGYAFARVEIRTDLDREKGLVRVTLVADPSRRAFVRKINISGNTRTRDEVIRRQFRQLEATWYDSEKIRLSRDRVDRLGFFSSVNVETQEIAGVPDQVDLLFTVEERPTNSINVGIGASTTDKFMFNMGFRQENAFGSGKNISAEINTSDFNRTVVFSLTDPFFTQNGISSTYDIYHRTSRPYLQDTAAYSLVNGGVGLRFGIPVAESHTVFVGGSVEQTRINRGTNLPDAYDDYIASFGSTSSALPLTLGWAGDGRDSGLVPTRGVYQRVNLEVSAAGDARYVKLGYNWQRYLPLSKKYTWAVNADFGWGEGLGDRPFPVFKNYFVGGLGSVRGFEYGALGQPDSATNVPLGGPKKLVFNTELIAPFPGAGNDRTLRTFAFFDMGASYGEHEAYDLSQLRSSVGLGFSWISPLGPLKFSYGTPVRKQTADKIQKFQFNIGTSF